MADESIYPLMASLPSSIVTQSHLAPGVAASNRPVMSGSLRFVRSVLAEFMQDLDPDGDGIPTWLEFATGTDPLIESQCFMLKNMQFEGF
jgi:hypothetical protein